MEKDDFILSHEEDEIDSNEDGSSDFPLSPMPAWIVIPILVLILLMLALIPFVN